MHKFSYLRKLINYLRGCDPYSNIYDAWALTLRNLENKLDKLEKKILKEVKKYSS